MRKGIYGQGEEHNLLPWGCPFVENMCSPLEFAIDKEHTDNFIF
jgi:hypothetical protein